MSRHASRHYRTLSTEAICRIIPPAARNCGALSLGAAVNVEAWLTGRRSLGLRERVFVLLERDDAHERGFEGEEHALAGS